MRRYIVSQFGNPRGIIGRVVGKVMVRKNRGRSKWVVSQLDIQRQDRVLEIGFGPGLAVQEVASIATDGFVAGIDHSAVMVSQANKRNAQAIAAGRVELKCGSVAALPYADGAFDKVFSINSIMFWPEPVENLKEIRRVLKVGGLCVVAQQPRWAKTEADVQEEAEEMQAQMTAAGFDSVRLIEKAMKPVKCLCVFGTK